MSQEARNVELLKEAYKRWNDSKGGSLDHFLSFVADDIKFRSIARGAEPLGFTQPVNRKDELRGYFDGLLGEFSMVHYTVHDYVADGDIVFVRCTTSWTNKKTGKPFETPKADFWRFRDGKVVEFYEFYDTAQVVGSMT